MNLQDQITNWIKDYATKANIDTLVIGVSGGIDSAVVSTLCARTGLRTIAVTMPIKQSKQTHSLSIMQANWLVDYFENAEHHNIDLTSTFKQFEKSTEKFNNELAYANSRARLRMMTLYQIAQANNGIVVGTGNKVEDFGVGFFTKYGDGGVDISPIADCFKTEVWTMGRELEVPQAIIDAPPTDGLWADGRTDEDQLGMSYLELEQAMLHDQDQSVVSDKQHRDNLKLFREIRARNLHKMQPIPIFKKK